MYDWGDASLPNNREQIAVGPIATTNPISNPGFESTPDLTGWSALNVSTNATVKVNRTNSDEFRTEGVAGAVLDFTDNVNFGSVGFGPRLRSADFAGNAGEHVRADWRLIRSEDYAIGTGFVYDADTDEKLTTLPVFVVRNSAGASKASDCCGQ